MITNDRVSKPMGYLDLVSKKRNIYILLGLIIGVIVCSASANAIYGGEPVKKGELDAIGKVTTKECPGYYCTGTLIQENVVLTVAHFFDDICVGHRAKFTVNGHSYPGEVKIYRKYLENIGDPNYDIALIILDKNINGIKPIPIADNSKPNRLKIAGLGHISEDCSKSNLGKYKCTLCTYPERATVETMTLEPCDKEIAGICDGDSGGPALDMNNQIVAIASEDLRDLKRNPSEKSAGNVFTEINKDNKENKNKYNWIQCEMKNAREKRGIKCQ
jgi:V8-like Glu-specific endopeptidase